MIFGSLGIRSPTEIGDEDEIMKPIVSEMESIYKQSEGDMDEDVEEKLAKKLDKWYKDYIRFMANERDRLAELCASRTLKAPIVGNGYKIDIEGEVYTKQ